MSEPRKNHLSIDGGQVKEDDHVASYKPIPESDTDFRSSKSSLSKGKEKASPDGAEEKLLSKEDEAKIVRVDMADAKYVVGDHRNGDAKIELDANKRQFSGMTKEELMKYADDPVWVNLRRGMFVLFWVMWLGMLGGAVTIIVRAPRCDAPREWYERYSMVESDGMSLDELKPELQQMSTDAVHGVFVDVPTYDNDGDFLTRFKNFANEAKKVGVKVIVNLTPNFVHKTHPWFVQSENNSVPYDDYFLWAPVKNHNNSGDPAPPNNWVSTLNQPAWSYSPGRKAFYLHQYGEEQPDLNFRNEAVLKEFTDILAKWMQAGADGVRLNHARHLLVNSSFPDEEMNSGHGSNPAADHTSYDFWRHKETTDFPGLEGLMTKFAAVVEANGDSSDRKVFTVREEGSLPELFRLAGNVSFLRPPSAGAVSVANASAAALTLRKVLAQHWPLVQLKGDAESGPGLALFSMVLPATPVLDIQMLRENATAELKAVREDMSVQHGHHAVLAVPAGASTEPSLLACARWKDKGVLAVFNPGAAAAAANLTRVPQLPRHLAVLRVSRPPADTANLTMPATEQADRVMVPAKSTVLLSYEPLAAAAS